MVQEQSLDHDLGPGQSDGLTLLVWEHDRSLVPLFTNIHTWNETGAQRMLTFLLQNKYHAQANPDPRPPETDE